MDKLMPDEPPNYGLGIRHIQVGLIFSMIVVMYNIMMCLPTAIVAMTNNSTSSNPDIPTFNDWNDQSLILFSYYWGYASTLLLGGPISRQFGFKSVMIWSMISSSIVCLCIPITTVTFGPTGLVGCEVMLGILQGSIIPMVPTFISTWVPIPEKTTMGTFIFSSKTLGTVIAIEVTGLLSTSWWGWPSAFYLFGIFGLVWSIAMAAFGNDDPEKHKTLTELELSYIKYGQKRNTQKVPWKEIYRSRATIATWIAHSGIMITVRLAINETPTYINRVLGFSIDVGSDVLSVALLIAYFNTYLVSFTSEYLINKGIISIGTSRKICNSTAAYGSSIFWFILAFIPLRGFEGLIMIVPLFICLNFSFSGYNINYNDLSPNFCSYIYGVGSFISVCCTCIPPLLVTFLVENQTDASQWAKVFLIAAIIVSTTNTIFVFNGSGKVQSYDDIAEIVDETTALFDERTEEKKET